MTTMLHRLFPHVFSVLCLLVAGTAQASQLTSNDLIDCKVLAGAKKQPQLKKFIHELTQAADKGDVQRGLGLAGILNNRFVCLEEAYLGEQSWTVVVETPGKQEVETTHRPTLKNLKQYPAVFAALQETIAAYQRWDEVSLAARTALGSYYALYHGTLGKAEDGYVYLASAYEAECGKFSSDARKRTRCTVLKQDKMLYLPLLSSSQRAFLDQKAQDWAKQYLAKSAARAQ